MLTRKALTGSGLDSAFSNLSQYSNKLAVVSEMLTERKYDFCSGPTRDGRTLDMR